MFKPQRLKCPVCRGKNSFVYEVGYCEEINEKWVTVRRDNGYCNKCKFYYKESDISLEKQARKYKIKVIKKLALKVKKHKNKKIGRNPFKYNGLKQSEISS